MHCTLSGQGEEKLNLHELKSQFPVAPEYLTQIFFIERDTGTVQNARLADRLRVSRPAVTQAIGRLKKLSLVNQNEYGVIGLTPSGRKVTMNLVRRHFLLEHLLVDVLDYPWDKCDDEAASLQSSMSEDFAKHLDVRLGRLQTCPHGNPMPGSPLEERYLAAPTLADADEGSKVRIIRITEEGEILPGLLTFCLSKGIKPGKLLKVEDQTHGSTVCRDGSEKLEIAKEYAAHLRWEPFQFPVE